MEATCRVSSSLAFLLAAALGAFVAVPLAVLLATSFYLGVAVAGGLTLGRTLRR